MMDGRWMEAGATPLLESFHIKSHPNERRRDLPPAVRSQASRLVHLGAKHFSSPTDLGSFSRLRTISFTTPQDKPLTLSQWQAFLSSTPRLRNIQIECGALQDKMDAFTSPIHLPELRELVIIQHSLCLVDALLGAIVPAQEEYPYVTLHYCRGTTNYTRSSIYESQAFPGSILLKLREVDAIINQIKAPRGEHIYHSWRGNDKVLTFDVFYFGYVPILLIPSTGLQFLRSLEIRITIFDKASELGARICLCSALEHLVGLVSDLDLRDMGSVSSGLSNLCNLLATPLLNQPASPQLWPCPNLRYLEFDLRYSWDHFQYIKNCIETRYGVRDMDTPSPPPVFLQELRLIKWQSQLDSLSRASETSDPVGTFKEVLHSHGTELSYGR
ncbi:hypothetical protein FRC03_003938 [Tulasnella sp. 419]|nr:hypothetical protein FRC03_003938 [Tulasnella sp. 419]